LQKTQLKSCCAINVLLVSEIQNFKKQKKKFTTLFSPKKTPQLRTLKLQKQLLKNYCLTLDQKSDKLQGSYKKGCPIFGPNFWA